MSTIKDVSRVTGLSISTISKFINGGHVLPDNRLKLEQAIEQLGYRVNQTARSLKTNRTMIVGILLPSLDVSFFAGIVQDVETQLWRAGYNAIVCGYNHDPAEALRKLAFFLEQKADGIVLVPEGIEAADLLRLEPFSKRKTPLILLDRAVPGFEADAVLVDNEAACGAAVELLIFHGHHSIGIITGPPGVTTADERLFGYRSALRANGIESRDPWIRRGAYCLETGYRCFGELMNLENPPTAVLCTNYELTMGAVTAARERNLAIPEDISFIGYDEIQLTRIVKPAITIVLQPTAAIARETATLLLRRMGGDYADHPRVLRLGCALSLNESVDPARASQAAP